MNDYNTVIDEMKAINDRLFKENETLRAENKRLLDFIERVSMIEATGGHPEIECELCMGELQREAMAQLIKPTTGGQR